MLRGNEMLQQTPVMLQGFICYCTSRDFSLLLSLLFCHSLFFSSFSFSCFHLLFFFLHFPLFLPFPPALFFCFPDLFALFPSLSLSKFLFLVLKHTMSETQERSEAPGVLPSQASHFLSSLNNFPLYQ